MAEVIRIDERLARQPKRPSEPCEARILLFTGVRYERWSSADDRPVKRTGGIKRKKH
ncbi:hypothetical protein JJB09_03235 [Rhizobium sp. KVB221]|uniref:Uncharacterized protein n=1 Tax=Rhizobium setariae TaxID=2801340 RepID=A0A937CNT4_9HYPH|nr:hypothetical protein [Rhizobium setariae]MBL0371032.1 hypothetical protein [Rhizobium setariae]